MIPAALTNQTKANLMMRVPIRDGVLEGNFNAGSGNITGVTNLSAVRAALSENMNVGGDLGVSGRGQVNQLLTLLQGLAVQGAINATGAIAGSSIAAASANITNLTISQFGGLSFWIGNVTQSGTAAPTLYPMLNTFGATITSAYSTTGAYVLTFPANSLGNNNVCALICGGQNSLSTFSAVRINATTMNLYSWFGGAASNGRMTNNGLLIFSLPDNPA